MSNSHCYLFADAGTAYSELVKDVLQRGAVVPPIASSTSPSNRQATKEILGSMFTLTDPRARYIWNDVRPLNGAFCLGNFLYFMSGSVTVDQLSYYNPLASKFSDDGVTIPGSCYGARVWKQMRMVANLLQRDPSTRRAVVTIFNGDVDCHESVDIPCPVTMQFFVRSGVLDMHVTFRSQNVLMVFGYDLFLFTMIQESMAVSLGLALGEYTQFTGSLHFYENERVLAESVLRVKTETEIMPAMEQIGAAGLHRMLELELTYQAYGRNLPDAHVGHVVTMLPQYWQMLCGVLVRFAHLRRDGIPYMRERHMFSA